MDGYICLQYSVLWGILGLLILKIGNRLCFTVLHSIPAGFLHITSWILFGILIVDAVGSYAVLPHHEKNAADQRYERSDRRLHQTPFCPCLPLSGASCGTCLSGRTASFGEKENRNRRICRRMQLYKIVLLFIIGAFLGDITETIFCRITAGVWMSHSSLVWGRSASSGAWAIALATWFLYNYRDRSDGFLFAFGTCLPRRNPTIHLQCVHRNRIRKSLLGLQATFLQPPEGRINLLYCFLLGIAAVVWLKNSILSFRAGLKNPDEIRKNHPTWIPDCVHGGQHARIYHLLSPDTTNAPTKPLLMPSSRP